MTSSVSGAAISNVAARFLTPAKRGEMGETNGNSVMHFLKIKLMQNISDSVAKVLKDKPNNWSWH